MDCVKIVAERSSALDSSSGVARMWVRIPAWPALVSLSKTLNHNCFVLRMGRKAVGPVCCVMHVKEPRTLIVKRRGLPRCFWIRALSTQQGGYVRATNLTIIIIIIIKMVQYHNLWSLASNSEYFRHTRPWKSGPNLISSVRPFSKMAAFQCGSFHYCRGWFTLGWE